MQQATGGEKSRVVAKPARSDIQRGGIALDAFASALFWGYVAIMFGSSEIKIAESIGLAPENVALICGNVVALVAVGLLGPRAHGSHLFVLGLAGSGTACILQTVSLLSPEMVPVAWSRLFACGASAILVLAWCEHISSETSQERPLFLALCSLLTIVIVLVAIQWGARSAILFGGVLPVVSAALGAYRTRASARTAPSVTIQPPFPLYLIVILFVFGFMISFFSLLNRRTGTVENFMIPAGIDPFLAGWTVLVLVIAGCVWMLLPQRHASLVTTVLIPLASLGLLLPPFLRYGLQETLPAVVAFIVICEAIICSVGPSNAKKYFHIGSFTFVFWTRSFGLIGMIVGYAAAILLFDIMKIAIDFDILLIMFAAYAILCLTVAVMLGRIGLKAPAERERESTPAAAAHALAERYGLTAREAEVLELVAQGRNMTYVQKALCISPGTSSTHINHIHQKLDVHSREELIDLVQEELAR